MSHQSKLSALHGQLIAGDLRAAHRIVEAAIIPLRNIVGQEITMTDPHDVEQACIDALLAYLQNPNAYDPSRSQLLTYLAAIAKGKALTLRRSNVRRLKRETNYLREQEFLGPTHEELKLSELDQTYRDELVREDGDEKILQLIAIGENELSEVARALKLADNEQGQEEARKRLERMRGRLRRLKAKIGA